MWSELEKQNMQTKTLFTWSGGPRSSGVSFFCFVFPRAWKQKKPTPLDRGPPLHVNRPLKGLLQSKKLNKYFERLLVVCPLPTACSHRLISVKLI